MSKKTKSILIFLFGLLISIYLGYSVWESGYLQTADNKASQEQQVASDTTEQDKLAADKAAADKAAADKAAADKAAADQAAADKAAADKAVAEKAAADQAAADKAAADQAVADKAAEDKAAADKAAADQAVADKAAADKAAADKAAADKAAADQAAAEKAAADKVAAEKAAAEKVEAEANAQKSAEIQKAMGFDILRIEPTGDTVIAGLAPAGATVAIVDAIDSIKAIAQAIAGVSGEFAIVLDTPLGEGKHELSIQAKDKDGNTYISDEVALVEVFAAGLNKTPVVILSKSGVATRMLQGEEIQVATENTTEEAATEEATTEETTEEAEAKPEPVNAVYIKAADVEGDRLIIAGTGPVNGTLNMYLNDQLLGQAKISENNTFIYEKTHTLEAGRHSIRADRVDTATNKVLGRAEVSLLHEPEVAAVEETTTAEAASSQGATSEATSEETKTEESASQDTATQEGATEAETTEQASTSEQASTEGEKTEEAKEETKEEIRTGTTVIIRRGDSLWRVSHKNYGDGLKFTTIFDANKDQIKDPNLIYPGQVFTIPKAQ